MRVGIVAEGHNYIGHNYIEHESWNRRRGSHLREVAKVPDTAEWLPKPSDPPRATFGRTGNLLKRCCTTS